MQTRARETPAPIPPLADTTRKELPMPLIKSRSKEAFKENIKKEVVAGKPVKQAVAIAYSEKRQAEHMAEGGEAGGDELIGHVVDEFMQAFEKKDRGLLMDALKALIYHIQDEDKRQDEMENS